MTDFGFLVLFPCLDQTCSSIVAQVDAAARHVDKAIGADLTTANQGHDESVGQRTQLLSKVKGE